MKSKSNLEDEIDYFGPAWLENIEGSLSHERQKSKPRSFRAYNRKIRSLNRKFSFSLRQLQETPDLLNIRLAEYAAESSSTKYRLNETMNLRISNFEKILLGKKQFRKMQNLLWYLIFTEVDSYIEFLLLEKIEKLLKNINFENNSWYETYELFQLNNLMSKTQLQEFLKDIFFESTVKDRIQAGKHLFDNLYLKFFDEAYVKLKIRRRGYSDKGTSTPEHEKERRTCMKSIEEENYEIKQRILNKQLKIFEANLDRIMEIESIPNKREKQKVFSEHRELTKEKLKETTNIQEDQKDE